MCVGHENKLAQPREKPLVLVDSFDEGVRLLLEGQVNPDADAFAAALGPD